MPPWPFDRQSLSRNVGTNTHKHIHVRPMHPKVGLSADWPNLRFILMTLLEFV